MGHLSLILLISLLAVETLADGLTAMPLEKVLPKADIIVSAGIISNIENPIQEKKINDTTGAIYSNNIRVRVLEELMSKAPEEMEFYYEMLVVKNLWVSFPGSGSERYLKPGEQYNLLITTRSGKYELLRAESLSNKKTIKEYIKSLKSEPANKAL